VTEQNHYDDAARERRSRRLQEMKRLKEIQMRRRRLLKIVVPAAAVLVIAVTIGIKIFSGRSQEDLTKRENKTQIQQAYEGIGAKDIAQSSADSVENNLHEQVAKPDAAKENQPVYKAETTESTAGFPGEVASNYGIFIDLDTDTVLAQRNGTTRINPASMTKVLTVLVAAEQLGDMSKLDDTFTMTLEITDYGYINDCSSVGFLEGEEVSPEQDAEEIGRLLGKFHNVMAEYTGQLQEPGKDFFVGRYIEILRKKNWNVLVLPNAISIRTWKHVAMKSARILQPA